MSPRLEQLSQGWPRLHLSLRCRQGAHERGTRFLLRTTRYCCWLSGDAPFVEDVEEGGVGSFGAIVTGLFLNSTGDPSVTVPCESVSLQASFFRHLQLPVSVEMLSK